MKKNEIIETLNKISLPDDEYWILAGSALVMHGVREITNDIDLGCTSKLFDELAKNNPSVRSHDDGNRYLLLNEEIEVFENWFVDDITRIDALPVGTLSSIRKHKEELGRQKDLDDIVLIDAFLNKQKL